MSLVTPGPGAPINPYGSVKDAAALNDAYEANNALLRDQGAPYGLSGSVYTQIADVEGEQNGFTYDRQVEKVAQVRVRASSLGAIAAGSKPTTPQAPPAPGARRSRPLVIRRDVGDDC